MKNIITFITFLLFCSTWSCSENENIVVLYTSVDQIFSEPILKDFEKETGIKVKAVFDTEETKSTGVLNRIIAEKNNPQCDVFWSGDPVRTSVLQHKNITSPYESPNAKDINPVFRDPNFHWIGFSARARVLVYMKDVPKKVPQSIFDFTKPEYKGDIAIANPLFGTTTFHMAALFAQIGDDKATQFLKDLKTNEVVIATSNGDVLKRVLKGEVLFGLTDTDDAYEGVKRNGNLGIKMLDQNGIGSLIMPNTVNLIKNSKHMDNGKKLMDYLLSKETEAKLAISCAQMPLHKGVKVPADIPSLDRIIPMEIEYGKVAQKLELIQQQLKEWVEK